MATSIYNINKGINKSIQFKGLKAQYIWYTGGILIAMMGLFALLYMLGLNQYLCLAIAGILGTVSVAKIYAMSNRYGEHGLTKMMAHRRVPRVVTSRDREPFLGPGPRVRYD